MAGHEAGGQGLFGVSEALRESPDHTASSPTSLFIATPIWERELRGIT